MYLILVNTPWGQQRTERIDSSGSYFDPSRIIWDERVDGALPSVTLGKMQRDGDSLTTLPDFLPGHQAWLDQMQAEADEQSRLDTIETEIQNDTIINQLKAMTNAEFDAWWSANVTNAAEAINVLKRVVRVLIRRVL